MHHLRTRGRNPSICSPAAFKIPACRSEIKHIVRDRPSTCTRRSCMNMTTIHCSLPLSKQKPWVLFDPPNQQQQPSSRCSYTFRSGKCYQQVLLDDGTRMHVLSARTTRTHGVGHAAMGPGNTSLRCPQTISSQGCTNALHTIFGEPCCMPPPSYPNESPRQFA
jgi:hypothetical protein